jgi:hypothetical protein
LGTRRGDIWARRDSAVVLPFCDSQKKNRRLYYYPGLEGYPKPKDGIESLVSQVQAIPHSLEVCALETSHSCMRVLARKLAHADAALEDQAELREGATLRLGEWISEGRKQKAARTQEKGERTQRRERECKKRDVNGKKVNATKKKSYRRETGEEYRRRNAPPARHSAPEGTRVVAPPGLRIGA